MLGSGGGGGGGWGGSESGGANRRRVAIGLDADDAFIEGARDGARAVLGRRGDTLLDQGGIPDEGRNQTSSG